jgi:hypothetical protein
MASVAWVLACAGCGLVAELGDPRLLVDSAEPPEGGGDDRAPGDDALFQKDGAEGDAGLDSGLDAGLGSGHDAGLDSGLDAGLDSGHDAGLDSGHDATEGDGEGGSTDLRAGALALGATHACAIAQGATNDTVRCWGSNRRGELGNDGGSTPVPQIVGGDLSSLTVSWLALGPGSSCAIAGTSVGASRLYCWGAPGGLDPNGIDRASGVPADQPALMEYRGAPTEFTTASIGNGGCGQLTGDLLIMCWGQAYAPLPMEGGAIYVDTYYEGKSYVGRAHACALTYDQSIIDVACWGANDYGQAGQPPFGMGQLVTSPQSVGLRKRVGRDAIEVAVGDDHACALMLDNSLYCWGRNDRGQLGDGTLVDSATPMKVAFPMGATPVHIALGAKHSCALMEGGTVLCWGDNTNGQLAQGDSGPDHSATPLVVKKNPKGEALPNSDAVAAGGDTTCVRRPASALPMACWGRNDYGQAGQPASKPIVYYATPMSF